MRDITKANRYYQMKWIVCAYNGRYWEEIAAFNCDGPAADYAVACYKANHKLFPAYRVIKRVSNKEHTELKRWGHIPS